ncbi:hypothetical protein FSP39_014162 [Pinctada imbricata]|uniref:tRNA wybutosine-synthesizing protein 4 n=1 Tax=Pinctada imbricata TaxID=66713 RepID=A0AA88YN45_PINIB|nr:hypothetical protein FSP39_014162 [Pinctada imbricata]
MFKVQGTNDSSIVSKCSMAQLGYFKDEYLREFVSKLTRRAPLIHRGYYIRAKAIDHILRKFLSETAEPKQIISLGAGFDSAYFRLTAEQLLHGTSFVEVDYPEVVKRKHALIRRSETLARLIPGLDTPCDVSSPLIEINTSGYKLLGADLTQLNTLEALLKLCGVNLDTPTLLLSECVLTYMTRRCSTAVIKWAAETFTDAVFVLYEQINPDDAFGLVMQNHFHVIGSPLKCINSYPTLQSQRDRFKTAGWHTCQAMDMNQFYQTIIDAAERERIENLEPFDEYEEWNLKCAHYMVICGYNTDRQPLIQGPLQTVFNLEENTNSIIGITVDFLETSGDIQRFGHSSTALILSEPGTNISLEQPRANNSLDIPSRASNSFNDPPSCAWKDYDSQSGASNSFSDIRSGVDNLEINKATTDNISISDNVRTDNSAQETNSNGKIIIEDSHTKFRKDNSTDLQIPNYIVVFGGFGEKEGKHRRLVDFAVYNISTFQTFMLYPDVNPKEIEVSRMHDQACCLPDGTVILIGGRTSPVKLCTQLLKIEFLREFPTDSNSKNNISKDKVTRDKNIENNVSNKLNSDGERRNRNCTSESEKKDQDTCNKSEMLSERINSEFKGENSRDFSSVICTVLDQRGDVPCPRWRHTATLIKIDGKDYIFLYGGRTDRLLALGDAYVLDISTMTWTKITEPTKAELHPGKRHTHTATWWKDYVIITGGLNEDQMPISSIFMFHLPSNTWTIVLPMSPVLPRYSHTAHVVDDSLILIGGVNTHSLLTRCCCY